MARRGNTFWPINSSRCRCIAWVMHAEAKDGLMDALQRFARLHDEAQQMGRSAVDPLVFCNGTLARIVWLQGDHEKAMEIVNTMVSLVRADTMEPSLTHV